MRPFWPPVPSSVTQKGPNSFSNTQYTPNTVLGVFTYAECQLSLMGSPTPQFLMGYSYFGKYMLKPLEDEERSINLLQLITPKLNSKGETKLNSVRRHSKLPSLPTWVNQHQLCVKKPNAQLSNTKCMFLKITQLQVLRGYGFLKKTFFFFLNKVTRSGKSCI